MDHRQVALFHKQLMHFMAVDPDMPLQRLASLTHIATTGELTQGQVSEQLGISTSASNRHVTFWSPITTVRGKGLGWLDVHEDIMDRRIKRFSLSKKGKALLSNIFPKGEDSKKEH